jgi:hypothetical protein
VEGAIFGKGWEVAIELENTIYSFNITTLRYIEDSPRLPLKSNFV